MRVWPVCDNTQSVLDLPELANTEKPAHRLYHVVGMLVMWIKKNNPSPMV